PALLAAPPSTTPPKWMIGLTAVSTLTAIVALALVALRPVQPALTAEQMAVINALVETRMGALNSPLAPEHQAPQNWQPVDMAAETAVPAEDYITVEDETAQTETATAVEATETADSATG